MAWYWKVRTAHYRGLRKVQGGQKDAVWGSQGGTPMGPSEGYTTGGIKRDTTGGAGGTPPMIPEGHTTEGIEGAHYCGHWRGTLIRS